MSIVSNVNNVKEIGHNLTVKADAMDEVDEDESTSGSDEDWEGIDEGPLAVQTVCLFCPEIFNNADLMFEHCHSQHRFDIVSFSSRMGLNCIGYIKFINYVRYHKIAPSDLMEVSKAACPWMSDDYMKPCDASDSLLTFDIESYIKEKIAERGGQDEEMVTLPHSRFEAILQKLAHKEMKLQNAYDRIDKMKEAAKTIFLCNTPNAHQTHHCSPHTMTSREDSACNEDNYFSTYDHFAIHHEMLQDKVRTLSYQEAIMKNPHIFQNKRVLDVGCGTAILSMFAAKAGASDVLGVDKSDIIFQAMDIVRENGFEKVIDLFKGKVEDVPVPETKVDVIVSEWMGYFLLFEGMLDSVLYARDKFLSPGGHMFPDRCTISLIAVADDEKYKEYIDFWDDVYGYKMSAIRKDVIKEANVEAIKAEVACSEPVVVKELDLLTCTVEDTEFSTPFNFVMTKSCMVTAVIGYFDCFFERDLSHKVILSTSPKSESTHWKQTMFLLPERVKVTEGEVVNCVISCRKNRRDPRSLIVKINFGSSHNQYYLS